ncbi:MAG TPA: hypothetical protein VGC34_08170, partial [Steroidobacteraceae bacterium]
MTLRSRALPWLTVLLLSGATAATAADDPPCTSAKWDVSQEHALFLKSPESIAAGHDIGSAPAMKARQLYELTLAPQDGVKFILPPAKKGLSDGAFAGLMHFQVPVAGPYRVSLDQGLWIDVVSNQKFVESTDFGGVSGCNAPRKIVIYNLPAGQDLVLQLSGAAKDHARVTLTPVPPGGH